LKHLIELCPYFREKINSLIAISRENDWPEVYVTCGLRSFLDQDALYAIGRTQPNPRNASKEYPFGTPVTSAIGGQSWHNYGLAVDVCVFGLGRKPLWDYTLPCWGKLGQLGLDLGLEWGGTWSGTKRDPPHFQFRGGLTLSAAKAIYTINGLVGVWEEALRTYAEEKQ